MTRTRPHAPHAPHAPRRTQSSRLAALAPFAVVATSIALALATTACDLAFEPGSDSGDPIEDIRKHAAEPHEQINYLGYSTLKISRPSRCHVFRSADLVTYEFRRPVKRLEGEEPVTLTAQAAIFAAERPRVNDNTERTAAHDTATSAVWAWWEGMKFDGEEPQSCTFDEPIDPRNMLVSICEGAEAAAGLTSLGPDGTLIPFTPDTLEPGKLYYFAAWAIDETAGNVLLSTEARPFCVAPCDPEKDFPRDVFNAYCQPETDPAADDDDDDDDDAANDDDAAD